MRRSFVYPILAAGLLLASLGRTVHAEWRVDREAGQCTYYDEAGWPKYAYLRDKDSYYERTDAAKWKQIRALPLEIRRNLELAPAKLIVAETTLVPVGDDGARVSAISQERHSQTDGSADAEATRELRLFQSKTESIYGHVIGFTRNAVVVRSSNGSKSTTFPLREISADNRNWLRTHWPDSYPGKLGENVTAGNSVFTSNRFKAFQLRGYTKKVRLVERSSNGYTVWHGVIQDVIGPSLKFATTSNKLKTFRLTDIESIFIGDREYAFDSAHFHYREPGTSRYQKYVQQRAAEKLKRERLLAESKKRAARSGATRNKSDESSFYDSLLGLETMFDGNRSGRSERSGSSRASTTFWASCDCPKCEGTGRVGPGILESAFGEKRSRTCPNCSGKMRVQGKFSKGDDPEFDPPIDTKPNF